MSKGIDIGLSEFPRRDLVVKQDVQLLIRAILGLGQAEVSPDGGYSPRGKPEEPGLAFPIPLNRVDHVWVQDARGDLDNGVRVARNDDCLRPQSHGRRLGDDSIADGAHGHGVDELPDEDEGHLRPRRGLAGGGDGAYSHNEQGAAGHDDAAEVQGPATNVGQQTPGQNGANKGHGCAAYADGEGVLSADAGLEEEVCRGVRKGGATELLSSKDNHADLGASEVAPTEAVQVARVRLDVGFELDCVSHLGESRTALLLRTCRQSHQGPLGVFITPLFGKPPRRVGCKEQHGNNGKRPGPLNGNGDSPSPLVLIL